MAVAEHPSSAFGTFSPRTRGEKATSAPLQRGCEAISIGERLVVADPENQEDRRDRRRIKMMLFELERQR